MARSFLFVFATLFLLMACRTQPAADQTPVELHTSLNSLDWAGVYSGILPCADCESTRAVMKLNKDNTYVCEWLYIGKDDGYHQQRGEFKWNDDGNSITLLDVEENTIPAVFSVGENRIVQQRDFNGRPVRSDLANMYTMEKFDNDLLEIKWGLVELNGKPLPSGLNSQPFMQLSALSPNFSGNGSCNHFFGSYDLQDANIIHFFDIGSTKMACPEMSTEKNFFDALRKTDNYTIRNGKLILNNGQQTVAQFDAMAEE
jgi:copper homeostasis protein (lipoprotein)